MRFITVLFMLCLVSGTIASQDTLPFIDHFMFKKTKPKPVKTVYIDISSGINHASFRDFATSPLFYSGVGVTTGYGKLTFKKRNETFWGIKANLGANYDNPYLEKTSMYQIADFSYKRLYEVPQLTNLNWKVQAGGAISNTTVMRINYSLMNNALGMENFFSIFGSAKVVRDISRKKAKSWNLYIVKFNLKPRRRALSYQLHIGLLNNSFRNGYAYIGQAPLLNKDEDELLFDGYQSSLACFRLQSSLDYTIHLFNKNVIKLSYIWDMTKTGGELPVFEMANHSIAFSLMFNTKHNHPSMLF